MSIERASPAQLRKSLEMANLLVKMGIGFIPMPVANSAEYDQRAHEALLKLAAMEKSAEASEAGAAYNSKESKQ